MKWTKNT